MKHKHTFSGQTLVHEHDGGDREHGYYGHPEDAGSPAENLGTYERTGRQRWYVERSRAYPAGHGYVGPLSAAQARREVAAWSEAGWAAVMLPSTPAIRRLVRKWQHEADHRLGRCTCKAGTARWNRPQGPWTTADHGTLAGVHWHVTVYRRVADGGADLYTCRHKHLTETEAGRCAQAEADRRNLALVTA